MGWMNSITFVTWATLVFYDFKHLERMRWMIDPTNGAWPSWWCWSRYPWWWWRCGSWRCNGSRGDKSIFGYSVVTLVTTTGYHLPSSLASDWSTPPQLWPPIGCPPVPGLSDLVADVSENTLLPMFSLLTASTQHIWDEAHNFISAALKTIIWHEGNSSEIFDGMELPR